MSIISQAGIILLIICIAFALVRSNRQLERAAQEGEHFVDEWALRETRRQEIERKRQGDLLMTDTASFSSGEEDYYEDGAGSIYSGETGPDREDPVPDNVIPMKRKVQSRIILHELNEDRNPVRSIPVRTLPFTIGRDESNDLVIDNLSVAKRHCQIVQKDQTILIEDAGSRNKLAVGGTVSSHMVLSDHLSIGIGDKEYLVELQGE